MGGSPSFRRIKFTASRVSLIMVPPVKALCQGPYGKAPANRGTHGLPLCGQSGNVHYSSSVRTALADVVGLVGVQHPAELLFPLPVVRVEGVDLSGVESQGRDDGHHLTASLVSSQVERATQRVVCDSSVGQPRSLHNLHAVHDSNAASSEVVTHTCAAALVLHVLETLVLVQDGEHSRGHEGDTLGHQAVTEVAVDQRFDGLTVLVHQDVCIRLTRCLRASDGRRYQDAVVEGAGQVGRCNVVSALHGLDQAGLVELLGQCGTVKLSQLLTGVNTGGPVIELIQLVPGVEHGVHYQDGLVVPYRGDSQVLTGLTALYSDIAEAVNTGSVGAAQCADVHERGELRAVLEGLVHDAQVLLDVDIDIGSCAAPVRTGQILQECHIVLLLLLS